MGLVKTQEGQQQVVQDINARLERLEFQRDQLGRDLAAAREEAEATARSRARMVDELIEADDAVEAAYKRVAELEGQLSDIEQAIKDTTAEASRLLALTLEGETLPPVVPVAAPEEVEE